MHLETDAGCEPWVGAGGTGQEPMPSMPKQKGSSPTSWCGLGCEKLADEPSEHLPRSHPTATGGGFQFHRLPSRQQQRKFHNFLIDAGHVGRDPVE